MGPTIKTNSLVVTRRLEKDTELKGEEIIAFRAERFGEPVVILHRFSHIETDEKGATFYRTHPEQSSMLDPYQTKREDLLGIYLFHLPYVGKWVLFLRSPFGLVWGCQVAVILLIKALILARWEEKAALDSGSQTAEKKNAVMPCQQN